MHRIRRGKDEIRALGFSSCFLSWKADLRKVGFQQQLRYYEKTMAKVVDFKVWVCGLCMLVR